jgi:hypothetical protein
MDSCITLFPEQCVSVGNSDSIVRNQMLAETGRDQSKRRFDISVFQIDNIKRRLLLLPLG